MQAEEKAIGKIFSEEFHNVSKGFLSVLAGIRPDTATDAQLELLADHLKKMSLEVSEAKHRWDNEHAKEVDLEKTFNLKLKTAEILQAGMADPGITPEVRQKKEQGLAQTLKELEAIKPILAREKELDEEDRVDFEGTKQAFEQYTSQLDEMKQEVERARDELARTKREEEREEERAARQERLSGLTKRGNSVDVITNTLKQKTEKLKIQADAAKLRADALSKTGSAGNEEVQKAMEQAKGSSTSTMSLADRLAALKS